MEENGMCSSIERLLINTSKLTLISYPARQIFHSLSSCLKIRGSCL